MSTESYLPCEDNEFFHIFARHIFFISNKRISYMGKFKRNLITTALPYANGPVHIGHLAGVYVPADIYVRYLRQKGEEVV